MRDEYIDIPTVRRTPVASRFTLFARIGLRPTHPGALLAIARQYATDDFLPTPPQPLHPPFRAPCSPEALDFQRPDELKLLGRRGGTKTRVNGVAYKHTRTRARVRGVEPTKNTIYRSGTYAAEDARYYQSARTGCRRRYFTTYYRLRRRVRIIPTTMDGTINEHTTGCKPTPKYYCRRTLCSTVRM